MKHYHTENLTKISHINVYKDFIVVNGVYFK